MKVAVCISGVARSGDKGQDYNQDFKRDLRNLKRNFPYADFYMGTWEPYLQQAKEFFPKEEIWSFPMPPAHYHPYLTMKKEDMISEKMRLYANIFKRRSELHERTKWQIHQILCHANMVKKLPQQYDVIVRSRFDTFTYTHADFKPFVEQAYETKIVSGFGCLKQDWPKFNETHIISPDEPDQNDGATSKHNNLEKYLFDNLIIHHVDCFDPARVFEMYEQRKLCPAEFGFYQVMSEPYGDNHQNVSGWAVANRCVNKQFLKEALK
jgi:hypothetical protein